MPSWTKEQEQAIFTTGSNIIVSAGAGSGKTAVLSERVINHLKSGVKINELLILTFTNAAAGEMKERIRSKISENLNLKENLDLLESSYITTFDSYCLSLVRKYNYILNVSPSLSIIDDSMISLYKENILDDIFDEYYKNHNVLFEKLISDFTIKNDKEIKNSILSIANSLEQKIGKEEYLANYIENYYGNKNLSSLEKEYIELFYEEIKNIETNLYFISESDFPDYYEQLCLKLDKLIKCKSYDDFKKNIDISLPRLPRDSESIKDYKNSISKSISVLKEYLRFSSLAEIRESFMITKDYVEIIIEIIKKFWECVRKYKYENDLYEFIDIENLAIDLIKQNQDIREEIKKSYYEIMIDEYQDTNDIQEEFIKLIENNNVYMVGDIKQSIYGFRNANPIIFKDKYDKYAKSNGGVKIDLLKNFRSRSNVLNGINEIFCHIMDDKYGEANYVKDHQMNFGNHDYDIENKNQNYDLEIYRYSEDEQFSKEEEEAFIIANDIKNKINNGYEVIDKKTHTLRQAKYSDFCIIMDRGSSFSTYRKIFEYLKVPMTIYEDRKLTGETDIILLKDIYTLIIKIFQNEYDAMFKHAFVAVGRSYLCQISDAELLKIIINNSYDKCNLYTKCKEIAVKLDNLNCYDILLTVIDKFDYYEKILNISNVDDILIRLDNLLTIASNLSKIGYSYIDFYEYLLAILDNGYEIKYKDVSSSNDSVKLMNIHKSKGLEFPVCYFSGYYKSFNKSDIKEKFIFDNIYGIITPFFKDGLGTLITRDLLINKYIKNDISEKIRLLYVSLTRAKEKMIVVIPKRELPKYNVKGLVDDTIRKRYTSFLSMIDSINGNLEQYTTDIDISNVGLTKDYLNSLKHSLNFNIGSTDKIAFKNINLHNDIQVEKRASKTVDKILTKDEADSLSYGLKVHEALEMTNFFNIEDGPYKKQIENVVNKLNITSDTLIYKEHEFMYEDGDNMIHGIIDLILVDEDVIKIVDYKLSNIDDDRYAKQLLTYKNYFKTIFNKKVRTYLYSIIHDELKEIII